MPFWQDLGRALRGIFSSPEDSATPEEFDEEEPEFGEEPPEEPPYNPPPGGDFFGGGEDDGGDRGNGFSYFGDGPYPENWNEPEQILWDRQMDGYIFENEDNFSRLQDLMEKGWMDGEISTEDRNYYREEFLDEAYFDSFDWGAFQEYYDSI